MDEEHTHESVGHKSFTRRVVIAAGLTAGLSLAGFFAKPLLVRKDILRPPGSVQEDEFLARCIRCYRCVSACPTDVLEPVPLAAGLFALRTPQITFDEGACTFCDLCRKVCPTEAIGYSDPYDVSKGRIGVARVYRERCLAYRNGSCRRCIDECPYDAIIADEGGRPVVDDFVCNGCGLCEKICPATVWSSFAGDRRRGIEVVNEQSFSGEYNADSVEAT
ncbi:MAG: 4Fe-4S dicluster domain-containing protein [Coriobacteriales bacterium]|jgi:ferredoxin-type protein NapG|nr:4Fe-4S dicluster domain-containing protein [Coriobacteriales bacterium]